VTQSPGFRIFLHGYRIEGPFTDLSSVVVGGLAYGAITTQRVLATDVSVAANTLVLAQTFCNVTGAATYSNSFGNAVASSFVERMQTARRLYTGAATDVHTVVTFPSSASGSAQLVRVTAQSAPPPTGALVVSQQPANAWTGEPNRAAIQVRATTNGTTTDTAFTGNVVASIASGSGSVTSGGTVAAVAGVATYPAFVTTGSGDHTIAFTASGYTSVNSAAFKVATGTGVPGSGGVLIEETMASKPVQQNATDVSVYVRASDGTVAPVTTVTHSTSGLTVRYRKNNGALTAVSPAPQTVAGAHTDGGFVHVADGDYRIDLPDAAVDTLGQTKVYVGGVTGVRFTVATLDVVAYSPTADNTTTLAGATATEVTRQSIAALRTAQRTGTSGNGGFRIVGPDGEVTTAIATNAAALPLTDFDTGS
jgi:hypothetical protein